MGSRDNPEAPTLDTVIWRYIDDWKFEKLLSTFKEHNKWWDSAPNTTTIHYSEPGALWFSYPWSFTDDPLEGSFPDANLNTEEYCDRMSAFLGLCEDEADARKQRLMSMDLEPLRKGIYAMAQLCGVSCWTESESESAEMWGFVEEANGVAIRSTCGQVLDALMNVLRSPSKFARPTVCAVGYVDHAAYFLPADGYRHLLGIIQSTFSYENEVRFVAKSPQFAKISQKISYEAPSDPREWERHFEMAKQDFKTNKDKYIERIANQAVATLASVEVAGADGFHLPVKLDDMISEVVLKPGSTRDYRALVREQLDSVGLTGVTIQDSVL